MSGIDVLLDSNIAILFLAGRPNVQEYFFGQEAGFSFISELEVLSSATFVGSDYDNAHDLLAQHEIIPYLSELRDIVIKIRSQKKLKLPDAIIAATAIHFNIPLVSADKGFLNIDGLDLILHDSASI